MMLETSAETLSSKLRGGLGETGNTIRSEST